MGWRGVGVEEVERERNFLPNIIKYISRILWSPRAGARVLDYTCCGSRLWKHVKLFVFIQISLKRTCFRFKVRPTPSRILNENVCVGGFVLPNCSRTQFQNSVIWRVYVCVCGRGEYQKSRVILFYNPALPLYFWVGVTFPCSGNLAVSRVEMIIRYLTVCSKSVVARNLLLFYLHFLTKSFRTLPSSLKRKGFFLIPLDKTSMSYK